MIIREYRRCPECKVKIRFSDFEKHMKAQHSSERVLEKQKNTKAHDAELAIIESHESDRTIEEIQKDESYETAALTEEVIRERAKEILQKTTWMKRGENIPREIAEQFIKQTAWWLTHASGAVRAPRHADRIYMSDHGWAIDFGANTYLIGKAIERCRDAINDFLDKGSLGLLLDKDEVKQTLIRHVSGAVANRDGYEYNGYYPIDGSDLTFGAQSINVNDAVKFFISKPEISELFDNT